MPCELTSLSLDLPAISISSPPPSRPSSRPPPRSAIPASRTSLPPESPRLPRINQARPSRDPIPPLAYRLPSTSPAKPPILSRSCRNPIGPLGVIGREFWPTLPGTYHCIQLELPPQGSSDFSPSPCPPKQWFPTRSTCCPSTTMARPRSRASTSTLRPRRATR